MSVIEARASNKVLDLSAKPYDVYFAAEIAETAYLGIVGFIFYNIPIFYDILNTVNTKSTP